MRRQAVSLCGRRLLAGLALCLAGGCLFACTPAPASEAAQEATSTQNPVPTATDLRAQPTSTPTPRSATPFPTETATATPTLARPPGHVEYWTRSGDTLAALAGRFGVQVGEILCGEGTEACWGKEARAGGLLLAGARLFIPDRVREARGGVIPGPAHAILPDSEFVFSSAAVDFDIAAYVNQAGGFLASHHQYLMFNGWNTGTEVVELVAVENSINPRLLLALLEFQCGCVLGNPGSAEQLEPFLKMTSAQYFRKDLWGQLDWAVNRLWWGYTGWREGWLTELVLKDGTVVRPAPDLNAGTVALQYFFSFLFDRAEWEQAIGAEGGFGALFEAMFGDPWAREVVIFPDGTVQPPFILPFEAGTRWSFTGGPHASFDGNGPLAALDFAPALAYAGCWSTDAWVLAVADGVVVRVGPGLVMLDLDGDGLEQTGWNVMYLHIEARDRVALGAVLKQGERIGHPSCEGGVSSGTHVHLARKFNGEWIPAAGALAFNLGGWVAHYGEKPYLGTLMRGDEVLTACVCSWEQAWLEAEQ